MTEPADILGEVLGMQGDSAVLVTIGTVAVANVIGRAIPDDARGVLGFVRKVAKVVGLYMSNRVTSSKSVNKVARDLIDDGIVR